MENLTTESIIEELIKRLNDGDFSRYARKYDDLYFLLGVEIQEAMRF